MEPYVPRKRSSPRRDEVELWMQAVPELRGEDYADMANGYDTGKCNWVRVVEQGSGAAALTCDNEALEFMPCIGTCGRQWVKGLYFCSFHCSELLQGLKRNNDVRFGLRANELAMIEKRCQANREEARELRAREALMT